MKSNSIAHTEVKSMSTTPTETMSISMQTHKPNDLRPASKNRVNFDHHHKHKTKSVDNTTYNKCNSTRTQLISIPRTKQQVTFDPNTKNKSNSTPHRKNKLISTQLLKSSQFDPRSKIKLIVMPPNKNQINFDPHTKPKCFSTRTKKLS